MAQEGIAQQFGEELQELLDRYKDKMSTPAIMHIAQPIFSKTIGFKDNPERLERIFNNAIHNLAEVHLTEIVNSGPSFMEQHSLKVPAELLDRPDPEFKKMLQGELKCED